MIKCNSEDCASKFAAERSEYYGWSIFSPGWFVGTKEQLTKIGVTNPIKPN